MILMIDNYDSFTYNIVQYLLELGAEIDVRRNDEINLDDIAELNPEKLSSPRVLVHQMRRASRWRASSAFPAPFQFSASA